MNEKPIMNKRIKNIFEIQHSRKIFCICLLSFAFFGTFSI